MAVSGAHKVCPQKNALRRDHISPILLIPRLAYHRSSPRARRARANYMRDSRQHVDRPWPSNTRFRRELMPNSVPIRSFLRRRIAITRVQLGEWKSCSHTVREIRGFFRGEGGNFASFDCFETIADCGLRFLHCSLVFFLLFIFPSFIGVLYIYIYFFFERKEGRKEGR